MSTTTLKPSTPEIEQEDQTARSLINAFSRRLGAVCLEVHEAVIDIGNVAKEFEQQEAQLGPLRESAGVMAAANRQIDGATASAHTTAAAGRSELENSRQAIDQAVSPVAALSGTVEKIEKRLEEIGRSLKEVAGISGTIEAIARQTNLLALNATIEAARAGEAGRGFAVVAGEVKALASQTRQATLKIGSTISTLSSQISGLVSDSAAATKDAQATRAGTHVIEEAIERVSRNFATLAELNGTIADSARGNLGHCDRLTAQLDDFDRRIAGSFKNVRSIDGRCENLLEGLESLVDDVATASLRTDDTPYVEATRVLAEEVTATFEQAIRQGEVSLEDLFDETYTEIPNTDPQQYLARWTAIGDRRLPSVQDKYLKALPHVQFAITIDRNHYLGTHNAQYSKPQGADPVWNAANSRGRRFFPVRHSIMSERSPNNFRLSVMRRDLGGGRYVMMKVTACRVFIDGRRWGRVAIGYVLPSMPGPEAGEAVATAR
jgi:methyl-accepting chemotaxis protein